MSSSDPNRRVAVDLLAIRPGGTNGGAKLLALDLLAGLADEWDLTCFCLGESHAEISAWLGDRVRTVSVESPAALEAAYGAQVVASGPFVLNFFPMQRVSLHRPGVACVSIIHDLQFADLPNNFSLAERAERSAALQSCVEHSDVIVTVSEYSKQRIIAVAGVDEDRIMVIHNGFNLRHGRHSEHREERQPRRPYFIYPANFWPHKNHAGLIAAYRTYRETASAPLDLVLTGEPALVAPDFARSISAEPGIIVTGYLDRDALWALLKGARAILFPSLYEGFGLPVVEAMVAGVPVACNTAASLPEIAGDAALLFDSTDHEAMVDAMTRLATDDRLCAALIAAGRERLATIGNFTVMCNAYSAAFDAAIAAVERGTTEIEGLHGDRWASSEVAITLPVACSAERLDLQLSLPAWAPLSCQSLTFSSADSPIARRTLWPGQSRTISLSLPRGQRRICLEARHTFRLRDAIDGPDRAQVAYRIERLQGFAKGRRISLWPPEEVASGTDIVALVVVSGVPDTGVTVRVVCATARPVAIALTSTVASGMVRFGSQSDELTPSIAKQPVTEISLPAAPAMPALHFPSGVRAITFRQQDLAAPAVIEHQNTAPGFSVIIPSFNQGRFIARTIDSVLCQDHVAEVLVLDGGSSDETHEILAGYADRIQWWSATDKGQADAVNQGLARSRGEYIAWINSDDTYAPDAFAHVAALFADNADIGVIYGEGVHIDENDKVIEPYPTADFDQAALRDRCFLCQPATFFRRSLVTSHGGLRDNLRYCLDYEFWLRLAAAGVAFRRTGHLLAQSRMYAANKTMSQRVHAYFETADMLIRGFGYRDGHWAENFANAAADLLESQFAIPRAYTLREARRLAHAAWTG